MTRRPGEIQWPPEGLEGAPTGRSTRRRVSVRLWPMATPRLPAIADVCVPTNSDRETPSRPPHPSLPGPPQQRAGGHGNRRRERCSMRLTTTHRIAVAAHMVRPAP